MRRGITICLAAVLAAIPLGASFADEGENGTTGPQVGGDLRARWEYKRPFNYVDGTGEPTGDEGVFMRTRLHMNWDLANNIAVFLQGQDSRSWGHDGLDVDADPDTDIKQAYVALRDLQTQHGMDFLGDNDVDLYVGRKALPTFGDGYIIATNDWENTGPTALDGLWFDTTFGGEEVQVDIDVLTAYLDDTDQYLSADDAVGPGEDTVFWGVQAGVDDIDWVGGEVYFWVFDGTFAPGGTPLDFDVNIIGLRAFTNFPEDTLEGFMAVFEYAMQTGDLGADDYDADFMMIRGEYALDVDDCRPIFGLGMSVASGDGDPTDTDFETWVSPLDDNHGKLGHYDLFNNSNVQDIFVTSQVTLKKNIDLHLDLHMLTLDDDSSGWFTQQGDAIGGGAAQGDDLGMELDLYAVWECGKNLIFQGGYSRFMADDGIEDATGGFDDDGDYFYLQMTVPFGYAGGMTSIDPPAK